MEIISIVKLNKKEFRVLVQIVNVGSEKIVVGLIWQLPFRI